MRLHREYVPEQFAGQHIFRRARPSSGATIAYVFETGTSPSLLTEANAKPPSQMARRSVT